MYLIYVAGPYRSKTKAGVARNIAAAERVCEEVIRQCGRLAMPVCPHPMTRNLSGRVGDDFYWLEGTMSVMRACRAVVLTPRWRESQGTLGEIAEAQRLNIPVFEAVEALARWVVSHALADLQLSAFVADESDASLARLWTAHRREVRKNQRAFEVQAVFAPTPATPAGRKGKMGHGHRRPVRPHP